MRLPVPGPRDVLKVLERGADAVEQLLAAVPRMVSLLGETEQLLERVDSLIDRIDQTRASADEVVRRTAGVVDEADQLLSRMEPSLTRLQPTLDRLAETTDPREVDAMVALVDLLPGLALRMETDVVPMLTSLGSVAPDLHDLLDVSRELNEILGSLPGLGRVKRRIDEEQAEQGRG